jgi:fibro-slime domain-containing protein
MMGNSIQGKGIRMKKFFKSLYQPIKRCLFIKKDKGVVLLVTLLLMLAIGVIGMGVVVNANLNASVAKNYIGKLQSFYAADAQVALLAQEIYDGNTDKYLGAAGCSGGGNLITNNCDFASSNISAWRGWHGPISWDNYQLKKTVNDSGSGGTIENSDITYPNADAGFTRLTFLNGATYRVTFKAKASAPNKVIEVRCQHDGDKTGPLNGKYYIYNSCVDYCLDTVMQVVPLYWCMDSATDADSRVAFKVGGQGIFSMWLDNVVIDSVNKTSANLAKGRTATSPSGTPGNAVDCNAATFWQSSSADDRQITVDLGKTCLVSTVVLRWGADYGAKYEILVSSNNSTWYQVAMITDGTLQNRVIAFSASPVQYVQMHGIKSGTANGYKINEFEVYGNGGGRDVTGKTYIGGDTVSWVMKEVIPLAGFSIYDTAFNAFAGSKRTFNSQLAQYIELPTVSLVNTYGAITYLKDTLWDFHSDRTNPEFEQPNTGGSSLSLGMVRNTLNNGKPEFNSEGELNHNINKWFTLNPKAFAKIPKYTQRRFYNNFTINDNVEYNIGNCCPNNYNGDSTATNDTLFYNQRFIDSLPFMSIGNGMYQYSNDNFFPLDNKGFYSLDRLKYYNTSADHNYAFTMQIHTTFTKVPGQYFYFSGDDDVWVFIGGNLVMDLGGLHTRASSSFLVDNIAGLTNGTTYPFDFFYCERHSVEGHCKIVTNLMSSHSFTQRRVQWKRSYGNVN